MVAIEELQGSSIEVHQILCGRETATDRTNPLHMAAAQMGNFQYLVICTETRKAVAVDVCWDVGGFFKIASELKANIVGAVFTHRHFDHVGGKLPKVMTRGRDIALEGVPDMLAMGVDCYLGDEDLGMVKASLEENQNGGTAEVKGVSDGLTMGFGSGKLGILSTPGHTPGSLCLAIDSKPMVLITGDTLFIGNVGRTDLPESNVHSMLQSLKKLSRLPHDTIVLPGHNYAADTQSTIGREVESNPWMQQAQRVGTVTRSHVAAHHDCTTCKCCLEAAKIVLESIERHEASVSKI